MHQASRTVGRHPFRGERARVPHHEPERLTERAIGFHRRPAPPGGPLTAQGSPRARFRRAIERGSVFEAELAAREVGLSLEEALELVLLYAAYEPAKLERAPACGGSSGISKRARTCRYSRRRLHSRRWPRFAPESRSTRRSCSPSLPADRAELLPLALDRTQMSLYKAGARA